MKIKTVCEATGLTDRAIRYYIEEGLIGPAHTENYLGRRNFDFTDDDVRQLENIATLRKYDFSVEDIKTMADDPETIVGVCKELILRKRRERNEDRAILAVLEKLPDVAPKDLTELVSALENPPVSVPLEDLTHVDRHTRLIEALPVIKWVCAALAVAAIALAAVFIPKALNLGKAKGAGLPVNYSDRYSNEAISTLNYAVNNGVDYYIDGSGVLYARTTETPGVELARDVLSLRGFDGKLLYLKHIPIAGTNNLYCIDLAHMTTALAAKNVESYIVVEGSIVYAPVKGEGLYRICSEGKTEKLTDMESAVFWQYEGDIMIMTAQEYGSKSFYRLKSDGEGNAPVFVTEICAGEHEKPVNETDWMSMNEFIDVFAGNCFAIDTEDNAVYIQDTVRKEDGSNYVLWGLYRLDLNCPEAEAECLLTSEEDFWFSSKSVISSGELPEYITPSIKAWSRGLSYSGKAERSPNDWGTIPLILFGRAVWNKPESMRQFGRFYIDEKGYFRYMSELAVLTREDIFSLG